MDRNIAHLHVNQDMSTVGAGTNAVGVSPLGANPGGAAGVGEGGRGILSRASSNVSDVRPAMGAASSLVRSTFPLIANNIVFVGQARFPPHIYSYKRLV